MANLRVDKITSTETFETTGSVQFDGSGDVLTVPNSADFRLGNGDFTIECWFYYKGALSSNRTLFGLFENSSARRSYQVEVRSDGTIRFEWWPDGSTGNSIDTAASTVSISTWHHYAVTRTNGIITQYLNGESLVSSSVGTSSFYDNTDDPFRIGALNANVDQSFPGHITNVRIVKGTALYTSNFKPPMKELEVVPGTVLLACQSKTDASLEKTGKTITVNGNAVANELTPGILTPVVKSGGGSAITGSVQFYGNTDYLQVAPNSDLSLTGDFTVEYWVYMSKSEADMRQIGSNNYYTTGKNGNWYFGIHNESGGNVYFYTYDGQSNAEFAGASFTTSLNSWYHLAAARVGNTVTIYVNGVEITSGTISKDIIDGSVGGIQIGKLPSYGYHNGYISNLRIVNGTALYTSDFIPPTGELKRVPGTVLLCCQDSNDPTQEVTGKTISLNGLYTYDTVVTSGITTASTPSNFTPQVGDDRKVTFEGVTKINTENYFYLPTGDTITRDSRSGYGNRGLFSLSAAPAASNTIEFVTIPTTGDSIDFGDLTYQNDGSNASCSSSTRGIFAGGRENPSPGGNIDHINYVTIASIGDAIDFGNLTEARRGITGYSSGIRGMFAGGRSDPGGSNPTDVIDFITIASTGNALDFGNLSQSRRYLGSTSSPVRGVMAGGHDGSDRVDTIDYVAIPSKGNAVDFGNLTQNRDQIEGNSNGVRGIFGGGSVHPTYYNIIDYVTIASTGDAQDFGDLLGTTGDCASASNCIRGVFAGGNNPTKQNVIQYVSISSMGNAFDFGDLTAAASEGSGCSDSHGGLG